jgi:cytochrome c5
MWSYDEKDGRWVAEGKAKLESTPEGLFYVGETSHFSVINMDIELDPTKATCVRVELDPTFSSWSNLVLKAYATFNGGTASQVYETPVNGDQYHRIAALPYGTSFPPNTLRLELRGTFNGVQQVLLDNVINTDARPRMTGTNLFPPYPYTECGAPILLTPAPGVVPYYGINDATGRPLFLTGPYGTFSPSAGQGAAYYAAIDPANAKTNLGGWWLANGFGPNGDGAGNATFTRASYMNYNDLGFGRDMHCLTNAGNKLACYVTNYGAPNQNPQNADDALNRNPATQGATVTMEFDPAAGAEAVQFYVFNGGTAAAPRAEFADLDGLGPKPVPHLCMVCHGGQFSANKVQNARFREFDLPSFRYSANRSWDFGQATLTPAELGNFAKLNQFVRNAHTGTPIANLINAWYPGGFAGSPAPVLPAPPAGWSGQAAGYHAVYGTSCRTCHVARDAPFDLTFGSFAAFGGTDYTVCGFGTPKRRVMPNAYVTYRNFWTDSPRVQQFEALMGIPAGTCGS